jgi:hypothetical protein
MLLASSDEEEVGKTEHRTHVDAFAVCRPTTRCMHVPPVAFYRLGVTLERHIAASPAQASPATTHLRHLAPRNAFRAPLFWDGGVRHHAPLAMPDEAGSR